MKYTTEELKELIQPILETLKTDERPGAVEQATDALVNVIARDREAFMKKAPATTSDGYHTFLELYRYRLLLQAAWFNAQAQWDEEESSTPMKIVKSWRHHDGELPFGKENYFIVVAELPTGQISNHYKGEFWDLFEIKEVKRAPKWDGHTPEVAARRIEEYIGGKYAS